MRSEKVIEWANRFPEGTEIVGDSEGELIAIMRISTARTGARIFQAPDSPEAAHPDLKYVGTCKECGNGMHLAPIDEDLDVLVWHHDLAATDIDHDARNYE